MKTDKKVIYIWIFRVIAILSFVTIFILAFGSNNNLFIKISATVGTISLFLKIKINVSFIGTQNNELIVKQNVVLTLTEEIKQLNEMNVNLVKKQQIMSAELVNVHHVENQIINSTEKTDDDNLMDEIRQVMDPVEMDLTINGGLDAYFQVSFYEELNSLEQRINTSRYSFENSKLNNIFSDMKTLIIDFAEIYHRNICFNDNNLYMGFFKYREMQQEKWKSDRYFTDKDMTKASEDLNQAHEILTSLIKKYKDLNEEYRKRNAPPSEESN